MYINNDELVVSGHLVKIAKFRGEWDIDVDDPELAIKKIKNAGVKADIFTFIQRLPESKPKFDYCMEWDSCAAIPIVSYDYWLKRQVSQNSRKKMGLARRKGVEVRIAEFNNDFVNGQLQIYHETPVRQNTPNNMYNVTFDAAKKANATFLDRAVFLGAYIENELIGFLKIVDARKYARTMGIIGKIAHREKAPMNMLVAKAVEICAEKKIPYLTYGNYDYGKLGSETLKEFKKNLGFENIIHPRYFIPLTPWGNLMLRLKLHNRVVQLLPYKAVRFLIFLRDELNKKKYGAHSKNSDI
jgi:hypothetical protein